MSYDADTYLQPIEILNTSLSTVSSGCLLVSGGLTIYSTSPATSLSSGNALTNLGGMSIAQNVLIGANSGTQNANRTSGSLYTLGGVCINQDLYVNGDFITETITNYPVTNVASSTNYTTVSRFLYRGSSKFSIQRIFCLSFLTRNNIFANPNINYQLRLYDVTNVNTVVESGLLTNTMFELQNLVVTSSPTNDAVLELQVRVGANSVTATINSLQLVTV